MRAWQTSCPAVMPCTLMLGRQQVPVNSQWQRPTVVQGRLLPVLAVQLKRYQLPALMSALPATDPPLPAMQSLLVSLGQLNLPKNCMQLLVISPLSYLMLNALPAMVRRPPAILHRPPGGFSGRPSQAQGLSKVPASCVIGSSSELFSPSLILQSAC